MDLPNLHHRQNLSNVSGVANVHTPAPGGKPAIKPATGVTNIGSNVAPPPPVNKTVIITPPVVFTTPLSGGGGSDSSPSDSSPAVATGGIFSTTKGKVLGGLGLLALLAVSYYAFKNK